VANGARHHLLGRCAVSLLISITPVRETIAKSDSAGTAYRYRRGASAFSDVHRLKTPDDRLGSVTFVKLGTLGAGAPRDFGLRDRVLLIRRSALAFSPGFSS
jgi:hypothetical protein